MDKLELKKPSLSFNEKVLKKLHPEAVKGISYTPVINKKWKWIITVMVTLVIMIPVILAMIADPVGQTTSGTTSGTESNPIIYHMASVFTFITTILTNKAVIDAMIVINIIGMLMLLDHYMIQPLVRRAES